jgi:peptidoglycan/xylan/chitin deacetylase (PgdA/CDA1 family)
MNFKRQVKNAIAWAWDATGRLHPQLPKLTILYYHAVPADRAGAFEGQMAYLRRTANLVYADHVGSLDPDRPNVAVTFDDAFRSVREHAVPALVKYDIPATIFVPTGWLGRPPGWAMETDGDRVETVMTAEELLSLPRDLIAMGSHTVDHPHLSRLSESEATAQLTISREALETLMGGVIDTLAFPYGDHGSHTLEQARKAGYRYVYTVAPQAIRAGDMGISRGRTSAAPTDSPIVFALKTRGAFDWMPITSKIKAGVRSRD